MDIKMFFDMGLGPKIVVSQSNAPMDSSRGLRDLELERDFLSLKSDVASAIYLAKRRLPIAC
jgi:hypothetical protein